MVLGSSSPRRIRLLTELGLEFRQASPDIDETRHTGEPPFEYAVRLARQKAGAIAAGAGENEVVIGGDTVVVMEQDILDKPNSIEEAVRTLQTLSGEEHIVGTALALSTANGVTVAGVEQTIVRFNDVSLEEIHEYVATGEPMDKAGAYGIQGMGAFLVDSLRGNLDNVIGLPRSLLDRLAGELGP
ncbi:septum formation protein Maf [candidate division GN15 bacterium]|nr:septum formation protein Maf [candidate division GN15 bacterium]